MLLASVCLLLRQLVLINHALVGHLMVPLNRRVSRIEFPHGKHTCI